MKSLCMEDGDEKAEVFDELQEMIESTQIKIEKRLKRETAVDDPIYDRADDEEEEDLDQETILRRAAEQEGTLIKYEPDQFEIDR